MSHFCKFCNVEVSKDNTNCPLCGRFVGDEQLESKFGEYPTDYPICDAKKAKSQYAVKLIVVFALLGLVFCAAINLLFYPQNLWFLYVAVGILMLYYLVFLPIYNHESFVRQLFKDTVVLAIGIHLIQWIVGRDIGAFTYVTPSLFLAAILLTTIFIFIKKKKARGYFYILLWEVVLSTILFIVAWFVRCNPILFIILEIEAVTSFTVVSIIWYKRLQKELNERMYI